MRPPRLEVAEVIRRYREEYEEAYPISAEQRRVLRDLVACRTAVLGGHLRRCDTCGHEEIAYNSCRNRHCPKCQARKQAEWLEAQCANLLDVPYFHVVFTLPKELGPLALQNKRLLYGLLFRSAAETLLTIAADPKHLGARIGFTAVLHTWGQTLLHHPHVHCVMPAGGLSGDGGSPLDDVRWIAAREHFFLPVRVLSRLFRGKYLAYLGEAYRAQGLVLAGRLDHLAEAAAWRAFVDELRQTDWVVYAKPPFGSPELVLKYLARYTHRVAISNRRLLSLDGGIVGFRYKDYRKGRADRVMRLSAVEFIRRFLLHVLPRRFVRIRHYGLLANRRRKDNLAMCRRLLATRTDETRPDQLPSPARTEAPSPPPDRCPRCERGRMVLVAELPPSRAGPTFPRRAFCHA
jgi:hypothetical protein